MAAFDPSQYETVDSRIARFYASHERGRIVTDLVAREGKIGKTRWIVKASVYRDIVSLTEPDGTGYAFEVDGQPGANRTSALENCETSAIGRALANIGYSGSKRPTREEMRKTVPNAADEAAVAEWVEVLSGADSREKLQAAWEAAGQAGVAADVRVYGAKEARKKALNANP